MIDERVLGTAVARGVISAAQAEQILALAGGAGAAAAPAPGEPVRDDENLRLVGGFADIFVTMGILLFVGALGYLVFRASGRTEAWTATAAAAWALAEFFTRRRRMALPSIVLLLAFALSVFIVAARLLGGGAETPSFSAPLRILGIDQTDTQAMAGAALVTAAAGAVHFWRFRVPITVAAGVAALAGAVLGGIYLALPDLAAAYAKPLILVAGLVVFGLAMRFDMSDPRRLTRRTDIAFWLHLLAAPMIVHPLVGGFAASGALDQRAAATVLAIFVALALVSILIDRRALLVSGLTYAGFAFGALLARTGLTDALVPGTVLALGAFILLVSAGWHMLRAGFMTIVPTRMREALPRIARTPA